MPGRSLNLGAYRFGFNGKEYDGEISEDGNSYDFGARVYDSRVGRWWGVDKLQDFAPGWTPFRFGFDSPITFVDPSGNYESTHTDADGNVVAVYNDGDLGIYRHDDIAGDKDMLIKRARINGRHNKLMELTNGQDRSGRGTKMGETLRWDSFTMYNKENTPTGKIKFDSFEAQELIENVVNTLQEKLQNGESPDDVRTYYARNAGSGNIFDFKAREINGETGRFIGSQISECIYVSRRDAGNWMAGRVASLTGQSKLDYMLNAGAFAISGNSKLMMYWQGDEYREHIELARKKGPPTYGEEERSNFFQRLGYHNYTNPDEISTNYNQIMKP